MKKKVIYLLVTLVVLLALIGPPLYVHMSCDGARSGHGTTAEQAKVSSQPEGLLRSVSEGETREESPGAGGGGTAAVKPTGDKPGTVPKAGGAGASPTADFPLPQAGSSPGRCFPKPEADSAGKGITTGSGVLAAPSGGTSRVGVAVVGMHGELLFGPATVVVAESNKWGLTALGALEAAGLEYSMSPTYGNFVISIAGQANRGMSGWMYKVNEEIPMVAANEKEIKPGDKVIWWYSKSMNNPSPTWEDLMAASP